MNLTIRKSAILVAAFLAAPLLAISQNGKRSPAATIETQLKGHKITIRYSQPSMRGRKIMGGLVPYGEVWRTGADDATALITEGDIEIGGTKVPAGSYTLYSLPTASSWKLIINKQTGQWGTEYDQAQDLARVDMTKSPTKGAVEQFTISFDKTGSDSVNLVLEWENTRLTVPVRGK